MTLKKRPHIGIRIAAIFLFAAMVNMVGFVTWVYLSPRSVPYLARQVEGAFNGASKQYSIEVGNTVLQWDGWHRAVGLHIYNVKLLDKEKKQVASFPEASVSFNLPRLMIGDIKLKSTRLISPTLRVNVASEGTPAEQMPESTQPMQGYMDAQRAVAKSVSTFVEILSGIPLEGIAFEAARIIIDNGDQENIWMIPRAEIDIASAGDGADILGRIEVDFWGNPVTLEAEGSLRRKEKSVLRIKLTDLVAEMLADFFPKETWIRKIGLDVSGVSTLYVDGDQGVEKIEFDVQMQSDVMKFFSKGEMKNHRGYKDMEALPELKASVVLSNIPYDELKRFWPPSLAPNPREWMMESISGGVITSTKAQLHIKPDDFISSAVSENILDAEIVCEGMRVEYLAGLPAVENVKGVAKFSGNSMDLKVSGGDMPNSKLINSNIRITNIGGEVEQMEIDGLVKGSVEDLLPFLTLKASADGKGLKVENMTGQHETDYHFKFPLYKDLLMEQVVFFATSQMSDLSIPAVMEGVNLSKGKFNVSIDNISMTVGGEALLGTAPAQIEYFELSGEKAEFDNKYKVTMNATGEALASVLPEAKGYIKQGKAKVDYTGVTKGDVTRQDIVIDVTAAEVNVPEAGWDKPAGTEVVIKLETEETASGKLYFRNIESDSKHLAIKASGDFDKEKNLFTSLNVTKAQFGKNSFTLNMNINEKNKLNLAIMGKSINAGPLITHYMNQKESGPRKVGFLVEANLDRMELANAQVLTNVKGYIDCGIRRCFGGVFSARWEGDNRGGITSDYKEEEDERIFTLRVDNAGDLLSGIDLSGNYRDGVLETTARTNIQNEEKPTRGKFVMKDFRVKNAPVLARLLTLGSFTGIADLLSGQGIKFDKADGEYTYDGEIFGMKGIKAAGNAIGLTADGEMNISTGQVLIRGDVVPALTVNRMLGNVLGNVPMVGTLLTGGEGQGVLATRYKISGKFPEPDVDVNPLSMLTPGFLRNIWGLPEDTKLPEASANENVPQSEKEEPKKEDKKVGAKPE